MTADAVADRRLHPATFLTRTVRALPQYVIGLPAIASMTSDTDFGLLLLLGLGGAAIAALGAYLYWRRFRYGVGAREIVIESGIFQRQRRVIPFDRIQDIDIEQGLLARMFGTAKVRIETGGGTKDEGNLDSVALAEAYRLREALRAGQTETTAIVDSEAVPATEEPLVFHMAIPRVLLAGLFNFSLVYFAFLFGAFEYVEAIFGFDPLKMEWIDPARALAQQATWGLTALALSIVILLGVLVGVLRTLARDYGFHLTRSASGFRRRRGLFTLSEVVIPFRRVQLAVIRSGFIARYFGWFRLEFQTLSADVGKAGHQVAAPFATNAEVERVLAEVSPESLPPREDFVGVSKRHILRQFLRWLALLIVPVVVAAITFPPALALVLLLPLLAGAAALQWRHHRYCMSPHHLYIRDGLLTRRLWVLPYERIQSLSVHDGPLQRKLGLASLAIDTAGASPFHSPHIVNLPAAGARALAARLLIAHREARARLRPI